MHIGNASARQRRRTAVAAPLLIVIAFVLGGCASRPFLPQDPSGYPFLSRGVSQISGPVRVTAAVPDAGETEATIGLPLYDQGIQPVWLEVENRSTEPVRITLWSIDPDYFSPLEVAWKNRGGHSKEGKAAMERWFHDHAMPRRIPAGKTRSGFVFTHLQRGTKGFNVDAFNNGESFNFTFFVPLPGFTADYMQVDFDRLYGADEIQRLNRQEVREAAATLPCCSTDESGADGGEPFNVILIGSAPTLRRALLRAGWQETEADSPDTRMARTQRYLGRRPDGTFDKSRSDGGERKELRLWQAPMLVDDQPVWIGQANHELSRSKDPGADYRVDPDLDDARNYVLQNFWYSQSIAVAGFVKGGLPVSRDAPRETFEGSRYFTDGLRVVLWLSDDPVSLDEAEMLLWERIDED